MRTAQLIPAYAILAAAALPLAANDAVARTPYDGPWNVAITTLSGACDSGLGFGVQIQDGTVRGYGGFDVSGRVARNGAVVVRISSGGSSAAGSGRLSASAGGGTWRGVGSRGACSGRWSASRK